MIENKNFYFFYREDILSFIFPILAMTAHVRIFEMLKDIGIKPDMKVRNKYTNSTILQEACLWENTPVARFLIENGADPLNIEFGPGYGPQCFGFKSTGISLPFYAFEHKKSLIDLWNELEIPLHKTEEVTVC